MTNVLLVTTLPMEVIQGKKLKTLFHHLPMTTFNDFCFFFKQYMMLIRKFMIKGENSIKEKLRDLRYLF